MTSAEAGRLGGLKTGPTKARHCAGPNNPQNKLTDAQVRAAVAMRRAGYGLAAVAQRYRVGTSTISRYERGEARTYLGLMR